VDAIAVALIYYVHDIRVYLAQTLTYNFAPMMMMPLYVLSVTRERVDILFMV